MSKPILCLDFDGVIHSYATGWQGPAIILDPPVPGVFDFLVEATKHFSVAIFSSRSNQPGGITAMQTWLAIWLREWASESQNRWPSAEWRQQLLDQIQWPLEKPPAMITIDDRAITFTGVWPTIEFLQAFKPWNKL